MVGDSLQLGMKNSNELNTLGKQSFLLFLPHIQGPFTEARVGFEPGSAFTPFGYFFLLVYTNPGPLLFERNFINPGQTCSTQVGNIFPVLAKLWDRIYHDGIYYVRIWLSNSADLFLYAVISFFIKDLLERKSSQPVFTWRSSHISPTRVLNRVTRQGGLTRLSCKR